MGDKSPKSKDKNKKQNVKKKAEERAAAVRKQEREPAGTRKTP